jgi:hypothetical protein
MKKTLFIILLLVFCLAGGAVLVQAYQIKQSDIISGANGEILKRYTNSDFGYSLQYPSSWTLSVSENSPVGHVKLESKDLGYEEDKILTGTFLEVYAIGKSKADALNSWIQEKDEQNKDIPVLSEKPIDLDGYGGVLRKVGTLGDINNISFDIFLEAGDRVYEIAGPENADRQDEIESIINSFRIYK